MQCCLQRMQFEKELIGIIEKKSAASSLLLTNSEMIPIES